MISDDQVVVLLGKANPVPSMDLLDPIDSVDIERLKELSERSTEMTTVRERTPGRTAFRPRLTPILVTLGVVTVAATLLIRGMTSVGDSPVALGTTYVSALGEYDWDAIRELFDPEVIDRTIEVDVGRDYWEYQQAVGMAYQNLGCELISSGSSGSMIECAYAFDFKMGRVLGLEPVRGLVSILASQGHIRNITNSVADDNTARPGLYDEAWDAFRTWVEENHPGDLDTMYDRARSGPKLGTESIALWEQYTDEFVAEVEAGS